MKIKAILSYLALFCLTSVAPLARATTLDELAGTYTGTITDTYSTGRIVNATETIVLKANGKGKSVGVYQGQTFKSKGFFTLISDRVYSERPASGGPNDAAVGYYTLKNGIFTTVVIQYNFDNSSFVVRLSKLTRID